MRYLCVISAAFLGASLAPGWAAPTLSQALTASYAAEAAKDYNGAIKPLQAIAATNEDGYFLALRLGWLTYCAGLWNESSAHYRDAVRLAPRALEPLQGLLLPLASAGKTLELMDTHRRILAIDPNNYKSLAALGWEHYRFKEYGQAAKYYRKAVALYPADADMLLGLALSLRGSGDKKDAEEYFHEVLMISPRNKTALEAIKAY